MCIQDRVTFVLFSIVSITMFTQRKKCLRHVIMRGPHLKSIYSAAKVVTCTVIGFSFASWQRCRFVTSLPDPRRFLQRMIAHRTSPIRQKLFLIVPLLVGLSHPHGRRGRALTQHHPNGIPMTSLLQLWDYDIWACVKPVICCLGCGAAVLTELGVGIYCFYSAVARNVSLLKTILRGNNLNTQMTVGGGKKKVSFRFVYGTFSVILQYF